MVKRLCLCAAAAIFGSATAFRASTPRRSNRELVGAAAAEGFRMVPLSNEEVFARMQQAQKEPEEPPVIMLYDDALLTTMQDALLILEKRVQEGPGSLTQLEVHQLEDHLNIIRAEMKENEHKPRPQPPNAGDTISTTMTTVGAAPPRIDVDTPADEGKEYNGHGGMGQPADTVNTYIIDGMEEMSPEEYQKTLQESVIQRQRQRKLDGKVTGNRATWDYLNHLTGESGVLKDKNV